MTPTDLDALEAAARAATPGVWETDGTYVMRYSYLGQLTTLADCRPYTLITIPEGRANAAYIAAANPAVILPLLAEHKRMREALEAARTAIESLDEQALGLGWAAPGTGVAFQYPLRDELLSRINAALGAQP